MESPAVIELYEIPLRNDNLLHTDALQLQLRMILEILSQHGEKLENISRKEFDVDKTITTMQASLKSNCEKVDELRKMHDESEQQRKDQEQAVSESLVKIQSDIDTLQTKRAELSNRLDALEPRFAELEVKIHSDIAASFERIELHLNEHDERIASSDEDTADQRTRLQHLEEQFKKANVELVVEKLGDVSARMVTQETRQGKHEERLSSAEKNHKLLHGTVKDLRPYIDRTFSTKKDVSSIRQEIKKFVTKEEHQAVQDSFHANLNTFVVEEMESQKFDIITKMHRLQERMAKELEEVSHSTEVQACVEKVQQLMGAMEDVSSYVSAHHQAIERNASRIVELGRGFDTVHVLRGGVTELQEKMEGMLKTMSEKVKENLRKEQTKGTGLEALGELDGTIQEQLQTLHHHLQHEVVPRPYLEEVMVLMKKRIADIEWKVMKRRSEDAIPFGENADKNREFNNKLFAMHTPLLMAQRATMSNVPPRPHSALPRSSPSKPASRPHSAMTSASDHPALARSEIAYAAASNQFESLEMRKALHQGQRPSSKGSAAAVRVFKRDKEREFGLEIPPELEQLIRETEAAAAPDEVLYSAEHDAAPKPPLAAAAEASQAEGEQREVYAGPRTSASRPRRPTTAPSKRAGSEARAAEPRVVQRPASALHPQPQLTLDGEAEPEPHPIMREIIIERSLSPDPLQDAIHIEP